MTSSEFPRHGHNWDDRDYRHIIEGCLDGLDDHEIAQRVGRKPKMVRERASYLINVEPRGSRSPWTRLRKELRQNPGYDWESVARRRHAEQCLPYWDDAADARLDQAWADTAPARSWLRRPKRPAAQCMRDLETALGIHEFDIARRLHYRGVAASLAEVVDRLGARADGVLAARARTQADRDAATLHVLTVTDDSGAVLHTSLHPTGGAAEEFKDTLTARYASQPLAMWTITVGAVGEPGITIGEPASGTFASAAPAGREPVDLDDIDFAGLLDDHTDQ